MEPKETVWHLVTHFFNDITHFDGKFFETVRLLLRKPGFLSAQYVAGRRASFLNPIRMYVFTSAIFFIILFSLTSPINMNGTGQDRKRGLVELERARLRQDSIATHAKDKGDREDAEKASIKYKMRIAAVKHVYGDSTDRKFDDEELDMAIITDMTDSLQRGDLPQVVKDRLKQNITERQFNERNGNLSFFDLGRGYRTVEAYDSAERRLPEDLRDGWFKRAMVHKLIHLQEEYRDDKKAFKEHLKENVLHSFPKILFITLPIFALILNILYFRHKKQYYYVDHGIFTIHVYCATFILLMAAILVNKLGDAIGVGWVQVISMILQLGIWFYILIYLYKAMRGFYHQGRFKTFIKYFITCLLSFIINVILFLVFIAISVISLG
ncbi:MAG: DUF3667 domain-containing protein [Sphingobacteriales bacterium]|nr:DUF3667 domain-containing protein [Sphingobacteriales bacterium]